MSKRFGAKVALFAAVLVVTAVAVSVTVAAGAGAPRLAGHSRAVAGRLLALQRRARRHAVRLRADALEERWVTTVSDRNPVSRQLVSHLSVLHRARVSDAIGSAGQFEPPALIPNVADPIGPNVAEAQRVPAQDSRIWDVWIVPGSSGLCLSYMENVASDGMRALPTLVNNCVSEGDVLSGEFHPQLIGPSGAWMIGVAPDGNGAVTLHQSDGQSQSAPVVDNVYLATAPGTYLSATLQNDRGQAVTTQAGH